MEVSGQVHSLPWNPPPPPHPHLAAIPGTHLIGGWVGHTACLDGFGEEKNLWPLLQIELQIIQPIV